MAFTYSEFVVLWTYRYANPDTYDAADINLSGWDEQLRDKYDPELATIMGEFEIEPSPEAMNLIVALAVVSNGTAARTRLRNACRFFIATRALSLGAKGKSSAKRAAAKRPTRRIAAKSRVRKPPRN